MKTIAALALASALAAVPMTVAVAGGPDERAAESRDSMSGMMNRQGMMGSMMGGMRMPDASLGRERPLLSLALRHRAELGLSEEQAKTLEGFVGRFGKEAEQRLREIETSERELAELLKQESVDPAQVEGKVRAIEKLRADLRLRRIQTIAEGRAALTPEQRVKLDQLAAGQGRLGRGDTARGAEEMHRFMNSERMPQAMNAMMAMAERMGGGDTMLGMVRMMEMMSMMGGGGMMGGDGMMGNPPQSQPRGEDRK